MIILGITTEEQQLFLHLNGKVLHQANNPDRIILGINIQDVATKRIWVDAHLTDEQRIIFLRSQFSDGKNAYVDYECIKHEQGRALLHVYKIAQTLVLSCIKNNQLSRKTVLIETSLHGLGRALIKQYTLNAASLHCLSFFDHAILLSVHTETTLLYYHQEPVHHANDVASAARRALARYYSDDDHNDIHCMVYALGTKKIPLNALNALTLDIDPLCVFYDDYTWLIPYGLALRGLS